MNIAEQPMLTSTRRLRHDLRTPVNHILGYSQLLIEDAQESSNGRGTSQLSQIADLGQSILRQIEAALPTPEPDNPEEAVMELRRTLRPGVDEIKRSVLGLDFAEGSSQFSDRQRLLQAAAKLATFVETGSLEIVPAVTQDAKAAKETAGADHLLVVDDDASNRDLLARMLKKLKYRVSLAANGTEALELAKKESFDLILLDLMMPGLSGYEVLNRLKGSNPDLSIIVISALNDMDSIVRCIRAGAEDYFLKPFEPALLRARISAALDRHKYRRQLLQNQQLASLGELSAGIAHELKNPLNFMLNFTATAADSLTELDASLQAKPSHIEQLIADLREDLGKIREHGQRTDKILKSMLSHCHDAAVQSEAVDLNELVERYVGFATLAFRSRHQCEVALAINYDAAANTFLCRAADMGRVVLNLVNNSYYAVWSKKRSLPEQESAHYCPTITITTAGLNDAIEITVRDNGCGIPPELCERVFQPFFTTKPPLEGTGLGLSISHDIVTRGHHGELLVKSRLGEFTEFIVRIPRR